VAALLSTIALFTAGFLIRHWVPSCLDGWATEWAANTPSFVTLTGMGLATAAIGLIPTFASIGVAAAFILFGLRMIQGLCLGGEYGGAITYVANTCPMSARILHRLAADVPDARDRGVPRGDRRHAHVLGQRRLQRMGLAIPFLISFLLVMMAIYIRLQLGETPIFRK